MPGARRVDWSEQVTFQPIDTDHLTIATASQQIDRQAEIIAEIGKLHQRMYDDGRFDDWGYCDHCNTAWPCETMRIVEAVPL